MPASLQSIQRIVEPADRAAEIKDLVSAGDTGGAVRRLLDFAREFGRGHDHENQAIGISSGLQRLRKLIRTSQLTPDQERARLAAFDQTILQMVDEWVDAVRTPQLEIASSQPRPNAEVSALSPAEKPG